MGGEKKSTRVRDLLCEEMVARTVAAASTTSNEPALLNVGYNTDGEREWVRERQLSSAMLNQLLLPIHDDIWMFHLWLKIHSTKLMTRNCINCSLLLALHSYYRRVCVGCILCAHNLWCQREMDKQSTAMQSHSFSSLMLTSVHVYIVCDAMWTEKSLHNIRRFNKQLQTAAAAIFLNACLLTHMRGDIFVCEDIRIDMRLWRNVCIGRRSGAKTPLHKIYSCIQDEFSLLHWKAKDALFFLRNQMNRWMSGNVKCWWAILQCNGSIGICFVFRDAGRHQWSPFSYTADAFCLFLLCSHWYAYVRCVSMSSSIYILNLILNVFVHIEYLPIFIFALSCSVLHV